MKPLPDDIRDAAPFVEFLGDLEVLGVTQVPWGGVLYAVIGARSNPRWWLLSMEDQRAAAAGLEMLQPVMRSAAWIKTVARGLTRFGLHRLFASGQLRLSGLPDLGSSLERRAAHVACFTGTDGPHRKTTLQVMDESGAILGYAKLSRVPYVRPYLRNEAKMLAQVAALRLRTTDVPAVQALQDDGALTLLVTDSLKSAGYTSPLMPRAEHLAFLAELRAHSESPDAHETLDALSQKVRTLASVAGPEWTARLARVESALRPQAEAIPICLTHGDFTPWNTFMQGGRLYVFDWEYANLAWPVGFDLAHFHLATIPSAAQPSRLPVVTRALAEAHFGGDEAMAIRALLLSLACHAVFYLGRLQEAQSPLCAWTDGVARAEMIDRLLAKEEA